MAGVYGVAAGSCGQDWSRVVAHLMRGVWTNLVGQKFNRLLVVGQVGVGRDKLCLCRCDCGTTTMVRAHNLQRGNTKSCGCLRPKKPAVERRGRKMIDLTGRTFFNWEVLSFAGRRSGRSMWNCRCECGTERVVDGYSLRYHLSKSCGCRPGKRAAQPGWC